MAGIEDGKPPGVRERLAICGEDQRLLERCGPSLGKKRDL